MFLRPVALVGMLLGAMPGQQARAAAMSTGWEDFAGTQEQCLQAAASQLRQMGYQPTVNPQTVFAWRGPDGVSVRCISERQVAAIFVYSAESSEAARAALDQVRAAYRNWTPPRPGTGPKF